jgi:predicted SAM-dependent methyltransferase
MSHLIQEKIKAGESIKLNLGCGYNHMDGFINIDKFASSAPDWVMDIEQMPWTIPNDTVDEVVMTHVLEHIGREAEVYIGSVEMVR